MENKATINWEHVAFAIAERYATVLVDSWGENFPNDVRERKVAEIAANIVANEAEKCVELEVKIVDEISTENLRLIETVEHTIRQIGNKSGISLIKTR